MPDACAPSCRRPYAVGVATAVAILAAIFAPARAGSRSTSSFHDCLPSQLRLSVTRIQNAFTGGAYPLFVNLRNVGTARCSVEGHPLVVVRPHPFPFVIGDLAYFDRNDPFAGPERVVYLEPNARARAQVVIGRPCDGARGEMTTTAVSFSAYGKSATVAIAACRRAGVEIYTGPFVAAR